jgi:hypothetical protein
MATNLKKDSYSFVTNETAFELCVEEKNMRQRKVIKTTLGDLIVAVTDEVMPTVQDPVSAYMVVSWVLSDVLTRQRQRNHEQSRRKSQSR